MTPRSRASSILSSIVTVHPHEVSALIHSSSCFFFILSAYFVVLPLRDEGAISLGLTNLPGLFVGSLVLTLVAAPVSTLIFSLPNLSKAKALVLIHRFFSVSLLLFFVLWYASTPGNSNSKSKVALLNLVTISSTWARVIDVMDSEKVTIVAETVASPQGRRKLFAQINSFIAIFILTGQLTLTVVTYVVTRPGRELLFTVVTQDEKYKAKVCIDVIVQRLGDATAAGLFKLFFSNVSKQSSVVSLYALPVTQLRERSEEEKMSRRNQIIGPFWL
ncbi:hypothetical protein QJS10_CPA03g00977 [Acorus calamus]|uniref:Uncharacterized protein n=1 Tax=Acorus calamus TaxID=4465 RepID=A0AAV9F5V0_ACOCL|nr:hypothetical protein QJS10_CPA03g00977 [Acorus calamus]